MKRFLLFLLFANVVFAANANVYNGGAVALTTATAEIGRLNTSFPAGDNIIIAVFQMNSGTSIVNVNANQLKLWRGQTELMSNQYQVRVDGTTPGKETVSIMMIAQDRNSPSNPVYNVTAAADVAGGSGQIQILAINGANFTYMNGTDIALGSTATNLLTFNTSLPAGNNIIVAAVQLENLATQSRTISGGWLNITRSFTLLASNQNQINIERNARGIKDLGILLTGKDTNAPANAAYNVSALAAGTGSGTLNGKVQIVVINDPDGTLIDSGNTAVGISETEIGRLNTNYQAGKNVLIGSIEMTNTAASVLTIAAGNTMLKNGTTIRSSNQFAISLGTSADFYYRTHALLLYDENSTAQRIYNTTALASGAGINAEVKILALRITVGLAANGSITGPTSILTGESTVFTANCQSFSGMAFNTYITIQNSTDNVTFTTMTTDNSQPIFANISSYSLNIFSNNSIPVTFLVNVSKTTGTYTIRAQCNSSNTEPIKANNTGSNLTVSQAWGYLNVTLERPDPTVYTSNVAQRRNFTIAANVSCISANPTAICGVVNGTAMYNVSLSGAERFVPVNTTAGEVPFWTNYVNNSCGLLNYSDRCNLSWPVKATGAFSEMHKIIVNFTSENRSFVKSNATAAGNITILPCIVDFTLSWSAIDFGNLVTIKENPAGDNSNNFYNVIVNPDSCNTDFWIKGTNLTNSTWSQTIIGVGNISWNNVSNDYASSFRLTGSDVTLKLNVTEPSNFTTWYWMDVPPVFSGIYNGTIIISGALSV